MKAREGYNPTYFLWALGAGGLAVSFFMYYMFLVPHPETPMPTFEDISAAYAKGGWLAGVIPVAAVFIILFAITHFVLLYWNTRQYFMFKKTPAYDAMMRSNGEVTLMTLPLTYTMTLNACFVLGAAFVPGLWNYIDYLLPIALVGFMTTGFFALKYFFAYFTRLLTTGSFDFTKNNNLTQMISIFSFAMVAVGFAAPGAMSHIFAVNAIGLFFAIFFGAIAIGLALFKIIMGMQSMLEQGVNDEAAPSIWIAIPILTLLGITGIRMYSGLSHHFDAGSNPAALFVFTSLIISFEIIFGVLGYSVMKRVGYFEKYVNSDSRSPLQFSLICPGVAFFVFGMFFINWGLVQNEVVAKYSALFFALMIPFVLAQLAMVVLFVKLTKKFATADAPATIDNRAVAAQ